MLEMSIALKNVATVLDYLLDGDLRLEIDQTRKGMEAVRGYTNLVSDRLRALAQEHVGLTAETSIQKALLGQNPIESVSRHRELDRWWA